jgi:hypothetical protein
MNNKKDIKFEAGMAGASVGTVLIILANNLSEDNAIKQLLVIIIPSISVVIGSCWNWFKSSVTNYLDEKTLNKNRKRLKELIAEASNDPNSTEKYKANLHLVAEEINIKMVEMYRITDGKPNIENKS